jgi:hypothetical protein
MKNLLTALVLSCAAFTTASFAADSPAAGGGAPMTKQQSKMGACNKDAGDKKGDDRKAFMKTCLSAKADAAPPAKMTQQEKMKACNADPKAKATKGDERKAFMKDCLSK